MPRSVRLNHIYSHPAALVWQVATDLDHLERVVGNKIAFRGLPSGSIHQGQKIDVDVSLFGVLPYQPYRMEVLRLDETKRCFMSSEKGAGVKSWAHALQVIDHDDHSQIVEHIEIDAGALTPAFCLWAKYLYQGRHRPRLAILDELSSRTAG